MTLQSREKSKSGGSGTSISSPAGTRDSSRSHELEKKEKQTKKEEPFVSSTRRQRSVLHHYTANKNQGLASFESDTEALASQGNLYRWTVGGTERQSAYRKMEETAAEV
ncbi:unnamed protein product [Pleuronectes platessa]|uniref:Uncharacterized protein n=1 Tax=Pleuronectes platessa TaxID=8262 RepID=A0A9N7U9S3_PLEPL|nr:unnamed protein product [Pleuronectes platessa]